jgi:hypothetical protein
METSAARTRVQRAMCVGTRPANERSRSRRHPGSPSARLGVTGASGGAASAPRLQIVGRPGKDPVASPNRTRRARQQTSARLPARLPVHRRVRATSGTGRYSLRVLRKTGNRSNTACRPRARPRTSAIPPAWVSQDCFERAITGICHTFNAYSRQRYPYALFCRVEGGCLHARAADGR